MVSLVTKHMFKTLNVAVYLSLTCLACYFIHKGNIVQRFQQKRTNFAEFREPIKELPTIVSWVQYSGAEHPRLEYGKDFTITYSAHPYWWSQTVLKVGHNWLTNTFINKNYTLKLEVKFDSNGGMKLKLIPSNYTNGNIGGRFRLLYKFLNQTERFVSGVKIALSSRNNSYCGYGWDLNDGDIKEVFGQPGEHKKVTYQTHKYVFRKEIEDCRERPYNDIYVERITKFMKLHRCVPCKSNNYDICNPDLELDLCPGEKESKCFFEAMYNNSDLMDNPIVYKPCAKLEFPAKGASYTHDRLNETEFEIKCSEPAGVAVKEEYVIYDLMAMISAIGGTLGLFVGFSFTNVSRLIFESIEFAISGTKVKIGMSNNEKINENARAVENLHKTISEMRLELASLKLKRSNHENL